MELRLLPRLVLHLLPLLLMLPSLACIKAAEVLRGLGTFPTIFSTRNRKRWVLQGQLM
jgi:hypothetical protein